MTPLMARRRAPSRAVAAAAPRAAERRQRMISAFVALGANLGEPLAQSARPWPPCSNYPAVGLSPVRPCMAQFRWAQRSARLCQRRGLAGDRAIPPCPAR
jgi:hypothetical protein